jgi:hypothetical protein
VASAWFPWAFVGADHIEDVARDAGLGEVETWTVEGRWFASINHVSLPLDEPPTEPTESEMLAL